MTPAFKIAKELKERFLLTYRCQVNLEGAINNAFQFGMNESNLKSFLEDILENVEFIDGKEN